jgi:hypothetical protein
MTLELKIFFKKKEKRNCNAKKRTVQTAFAVRLDAKAKWQTNIVEQTAISANVLVKTSSPGCMCPKSRCDERDVVNFSCQILTH